MPSSLGRLFSPKSIAVIGASPNPGKIGNVLMQNLLGFSGSVYPVHPSAHDVLGHRAHPTVASIPHPVDLALLAIPQGVVVASLEDCAKAGVGAAIVYSGGWAETGDQGKSAQQEITRIAQTTGMRILGPNTSGFVNPSAGIFATFVANLPNKITPGSVAIVAQSGGVNLSLCFLAQNEGLGVRIGVGLGNACDVGLSDVLGWISSDAETKVVALAIESAADGRKLFAAIERLVDRCPVVALTAGRTDVTGFAKSHTGALTGSYIVKRAALSQAGAVVVDDLGEMIDAVKALSATRLPASQTPGVGVVTGQAGPGLLLTDALQTRGLRIPPLSAPTRERISTLLPPLTYQSNPVDTGRPGPTFSHVLQAVKSSDGIDVLAVSLIHEPDAVDPASVLKDSAPCVLCSIGPTSDFESLRSALRSNGIPVFPSPERAAVAVAALVADSQQSWRRVQLESSATHPTKASFCPSDGRWDEASAKELLNEIGISTPKRQVCHSHDQAHAALDTFRTPVAVKILNPDVQHKTEIGGIHLNVRAHSELDAALTAIDAIPGSQYLIETMVEAGPELLLGARRDPSFGPIVVLGSGGIDTEIESDISIRLAPVRLIDAQVMLGELRSSARYRGFRGQAAVDEAELAKIIQSMGRLIAERDDIAEIEINPLRVTSHELVALDALVIGQ